jgi:hypothetical protein
MSNQNEFFHRCACAPGRVDFEQKFTLVNEEGNSPHTHSKRRTIMSNPYFNEQLAQAHRQVLIQEAQQEQLLAQLPQSHHSLVQYITAKLNSFSLAIGTRLKKLTSHRQHALSD